VGSLPVADSEEVKRTNEIKMAIPLLEAIDIKGREITADALLTQRALARYLVEKRQAHYHFTVKKNQPGLLEDIIFFFQDRQEPDFVEYTPPDHGRIETRKIWTTTELNTYLNFPYVGQAFVIERESIQKKTGRHTCEIAYGLTSRTPELNGSCAPTGATGVSKIVATTSSTGTMMKIVVAFVKDMARKTSLVFVVSPSALSSLRASGASPRKCGNSLEMLG
jgi:hypothetical protein